MESRRRRKGFQPAGSVRPDELGLPATRSREMQLLLAWRRVAGEVMARSTPVLGVRRGVLEIEAIDRRWAETLRRLLPRLAGRVAMICPALRIRRCRVVEPGAESESGEAVPVMLESAAPDGPMPPPAGLASPTIDPRPVEEPSKSERLHSAMQRYLHRSGEHGAD